MSTTPVRFSRGAAVLVIMTALLAAACTDSASNDERVAVAIVVREGEVVTGGGEHDVPLDSTVTLTIDSDVADEAHVHGYDHELVVGPDAVATVTFTADLPGAFEIELHDAGTVLAELVVS